MSTHTHPCSHCQTPVECEGDALIDGCAAYHRAGSHVLCDSCILALREPCHVCGDPAVQVIDDCDDASGYRGAIGLCATHLAERR